VASNEFDTLKSAEPLSTSSKPVLACAWTTARSPAFSTSTLAIACPAELEKDPAGVVTMPIVWAPAAPVSNGAHSATTRSDFMVDPSSCVGGLGCHFFCGAFLLLGGEQQCRRKSDERQRSQRVVQELEVPARLVHPGDERHGERARPERDHVAHRIGARAPFFCGVARDHGVVDRDLPEHEEHHRDSGRKHQIAFGRSGEGKERYL